MAHWLDREEKEKAAREQSAAHEAQEAASVQRFEESVHEDLKGFYNLCDRVIAVRPYSLIVARLRVRGNKAFFEMVEGDPYSIGGSTDIRKTRGIQFNCSATGDISLSVLTIVNRHSHSSGLHQETDVVEFRRTVLPQDLVQWSHASMLGAIEWLLVESDDVQQHLPGTSGAG